MPNQPSDFATFFTRATGHAPHPWQVALAADPVPSDRAIRIPTGFGKTAGSVLAWLLHRVAHANLAWPTRLAFTLPMRTLVEQTESEVNQWLAALGLTDHVDVHRLIGGAEAGAFHLHPERPTILIGTLDMLVSRALNRGFGASRARWPIDFGLLSNDTLWVCDEVQLMDVALTTSTQLSAFRTGAFTTRPTATWWMSATLQPRWFGSVDMRHAALDLAANMLTLSPPDWTSGLGSNPKTLTLREDLTEPADLARTALELAPAGALTLIVVNTVERATLVFAALQATLHPPAKKKKSDAPPPTATRPAPDIHLVHSRFRPADRATWSARFLSRTAPIPETGRIIVATQVIEAGVDISAALLVTDLAPWASLVQRFGRVARYAAESGHVIIAATVPRDAKKALPYPLDDLTAAREALDAFSAANQTSVDARALDTFETSLASNSPTLLERLFPHKTDHVIRRQDLFELFDTSADLSGADLDVSRWVRAGDERDLALLWRPIETADRELSASAIGTIHRDELCPVAIGVARDFLDRLAKANTPAWIRDFVADRWVRVGNDTRIHPGLVILLPLNAGGYGPHGFDRNASDPVPPVSQTNATDADERANERLEIASAGFESDALSANTGAIWQSIAVHGGQVAIECRAMAEALDLSSTDRHALDLAARWHDLGKAHPAFQMRIKDDARTAAGTIAAGRDIAKAPDDAWSRKSDRRGFRHELMSLLGLFDFVWRLDPLHPWLVGDLSALMTALGEPPLLPEADDRVSADHPLAVELLRCDAATLDLVAFLIVAHHGKVRTSLASTALDQAATADTSAHPHDTRDLILGVRDTDRLPATALVTANGATAMLPGLVAHLDIARLGLNPRFGASWTERIGRLVAHHGPFRLAYLEAMLRAADVRASMRLDLAPSTGVSA